MLIAMGKFVVKSSVFASLLIFAYHGYVMATNGHGFTAERTSEKLIIAAIIVSSAYYYFLSIFADYIFSLELENGGRKKITWIIEVIQLVAYFYIWDSLKKDNLTPYSWVLIIINSTYIVWDLIHWKNNFDKKNPLVGIFVVDVCCLVLSVVFSLGVSGNLPSVEKYDETNTQRAIFVTIWSILIAVVSLFGVAWSIIVLAKKSKTTSTQSASDVNAPQSAVVPETANQPDNNLN
jgi:hypothetical protein